MHRPCRPFSLPLLVDRLFLPKPIRIFIFTCLCNCRQRIFFLKELEQEIFSPIFFSSNMGSTVSLQFYSLSLFVYLLEGGVESDFRAKGSPSTANLKKK
jgi:hypothetical protein